MLYLSLSWKIQDISVTLRTILWQYSVFWNWPLQQGTELFSVLRAFRIIWGQAIPTAMKAAINISFTACDVDEIYFKSNVDI